MDVKEKRKKRKAFSGIIQLKGIKKEYIEKMVEQITI